MAQQALAADRFAHEIGGIFATGFGSYVISIFTAAAEAQAFGR